MSLMGFQVIGYIIFVLLNVIDYRLTKVILENGGKEFNPVVRFLNNKMGSAGIVLVKLLLLGTLGLQCLLGVLDLYTIYYLDFLFTVVLILMYFDGRKVGLVFFDSK